MGTVAVLVIVINQLAKCCFTLSIRVPDLHVTLRHKPADFDHDYANHVAADTCFAVPMSAVSKLSIRLLSLSVAIYLLLCC